MKFCLTRKNASSRLWLCIVFSLLLHGLALSPKNDRTHAAKPETSTQGKLTAILQDRTSPPPPQQSTAKPVDKPEKRTANRASAGRQITPSLPPQKHSKSDPYLAPDEVEQAAYLIDIAELPSPTDYPLLVGFLRIKLLINSLGKVSDMEILETTLPESFVLSIADSYQQQANFKPAQVSGRAVNSWQIVEITYGEVEPMENPSP